MYLFWPKICLGATLTLNPSSAQVAVNTPFAVDIYLDTKAERTTATDIVLSFDPTYLEVTNVAFKIPNLYPINSKIIDNTTGKIRITSAEDNVTDVFTGADTLATLTITPKVLGNSSLVFTCEMGKTNESNVFKKGTSTDILECSGLGNGTYIISTTTGAITQRPATPIPIPQSGSIGPTAALIFGGAAILGVGAFLIFIL